MEGTRQYIAIDLKSFYASVECRDRGLDPMVTNLVVADESRTEKTICLAVSPALKSHGIPGRPRLFEVVQKVREANHLRQKQAPGGFLQGESYDARELSKDPSLAISYLVAPPQMARYMEVSTQIVQIYLRYVAPEDIHIYSIDEVFLDVTHYIVTAGCTAYEFALRMIQDVYESTGITATAGIGTNLYLCKVAMDILAKKMPATANGARIAELDEKRYRELLWHHTPLTSFWRVGRGTASKLEAYGITTMGDIARCSLMNEDLLYDLFGVNAELLIDHAWGVEPCLISDIKAYRPQTNSLGAGQVLSLPYTAEKAKLIVQEMTDSLVLELVEKRLVTSQMVLEIGYDIENLSDPTKRSQYKGDCTVDRYGRKVPKHAHGSVNLGSHSSSSKHIIAETLALYDRIINPKLLIRRITVTAANVLREETVANLPHVEQLSLLIDYEAKARQEAAQAEALQKERAKQEAILKVRKAYGKNAILKGFNLEEGATARERNQQIGGHKK